MPKATSDQLQAFANELVAAMEAAGVTRRTLADAFDVTTQAVDYWVNGQREPDIRTIASLETYLGAQGRLINQLGYTVEALGPTRRDGGWKVRSTPTPAEEIEIAASGVDLNELRERDPESYDAIINQARIALNRARERPKR